MGDGLAAANRDDLAFGRQRREPARLFVTFSERPFAKDGLARRQRHFDQRRVPVGPHGDHDDVHVRAGAERVRAFEGPVDP